MLSETMFDKQLFTFNRQHFILTHTPFHVTRHTTSESQCEMTLKGLVSLNGLGLGRAGWYDSIKF